MSTNTSTQLTTTHPATPSSVAGIMERVMLVGDLSKLTDEERVSYYFRVCDSLGLNPYTRPFDYLTLKNKLVLYAKKDAAEQLRKINGVSITRLERSVEDGLCIVTASARTKDGREDTDMGAVSIGNVRGEELANVMLKATTKAKRRVTLSICGLGMLDETEVDSIPGAQPLDITIERPNGRTVNTATGEVIDDPTMIGVYDALWRRLNDAASGDDLKTAWTSVNAARKAGTITADDLARLTTLKDTVKTALAAPQVIDAQPSPAVVASYDELERRVGLVTDEDGAHEVRQDALTARDAGPDAGGITPEQYATIDKHIDERLTVALPF